MAPSTTAGAAAAAGAAADGGSGQPEPGLTYQMGSRGLYLAVRSHHVANVLEPMAKARIKTAGCSKARVITRVEVRKVCARVVSSAAVPHLPSYLVSPPTNRR